MANFFCCCLQNSCKTHHGFQSSCKVPLLYLLHLLKLNNNKKTFLRTNHAILQAMSHSSIYVNLLSNCFSFSSTVTTSPYQRKICCLTECLQAPAIQQNYISICAKVELYECSKSFNSYYNKPPMQGIYHCSLVPMTQICKPCLCLCSCIMHT